MQRQQDMIDYAKIIKQLKEIKSIVSVLAVSYSDISLSLVECGFEMYDDVFIKIEEQYENQAKIYNAEIWRLLNEESPTPVYFVYIDDLHEINENINDAIEGLKNRIVAELDYQ